MNVLAWTACLTLCAASCAHPQPSPAPTTALATAADHDRAADVLMQADRQFDLDTASGGAQAWVSYFAPNGVMLLGNDPAISGHDEILKAMQGALATSTLRWQPTRAGFIVPDQLGFTTGRYQSQRQGAPVRPGTYMTVWRRQDDGQWKVIFDTGIPDPN